MKLDVKFDSNTLLLIQIIMLLLKLFNIVRWSWWIVFIPSYIALGIIVFSIILVIILLLNKN